ncbi:MAG TPA: hypothetical protein VIN08_26530 [Ohtaekwangia sp.]|uniref:DUF5412 family protein n=1 Tax=Ohtaekwangia sp. TaxID=2066019 RepID=UPI002F955993
MARKIFYGLLIIIAILGTLYIAVGILYTYGTGDMCGNQMVKELTSPDGKYKAVVFIRDCGATTGFSTQVSILDNTTALDNDMAGNILVMSDHASEGRMFAEGGARVNIAWINNRKLRIQYDPRTETYEQKTEWNDTEIVYEKYIPESSAHSQE